MFDGESSRVREQQMDTECMEPPSPAESLLN